MRARTAVLIALGLSVVAGPVGAQETQSRRAGSFVLSAGTFNMGHANPSRGLGLEYRLDAHPLRPRGPGRFSLVPAFGITGTSRNALFIYSGLRTDFDLGARWRLTPGFAVGGYHRNGDIDLGGPIEFRSSLDISRALDSGVRLGRTLYHIPHARRYDRNPGVNALALVQAF